MARIRQDQPLVPSVIDRLLDDEPENRFETERSRNVVLRDIKQAIRRDLENLLNTRCRCVPFPRELTELEHSLVNYGIPDFTGVRLSNAREREDFRRTIERTIKNFEPRFKTVNVKFLENASETDRTLRFRVDAMLYAEPAPEPVVFDTAMEPTKQTFSVKGSAR